jgi:hypothetical protein
LEVEFRHASSFAHKRFDDALRLPSELLGLQRIAFNTTQPSPNPRPDGALVLANFPNFPNFPAPHLLWLARKSAASVLVSEQLRKTVIITKSAVGLASGWDLS